ncbi:polyprenol reductase isoform X1 [Bactrocera neohumeralis]|uniref:polyprenol reductase isoform X1 n=2 Tax=Bactrocera tryoni TaxID=59916 RepID=UPI001A966865|nr:polyprenol reductase isoform X1 [Bactrocera tryoni]XP_050321808.1 polyprenol reductase isoform X1 [Bactrocera neohumeralis]
MLTNIYNTTYKFIEMYNFNILNFIFIGFTVVIVIFGSLINIVETLLPDCLRQSFRYGKHCHKGPANALISMTEIPKSWFKHFYIFSFTWSLLALSLLLKGFIMNATAPELVLEFLDFVAGGQANRNVQVNSTSALVASVLLTIQCARRFYETNFVQIFSKNSKINWSHYLVGHLHYFGAILALLSNTEGFVRGTLPSAFSLKHITLIQCLCIFIFHFSWTQQYKSNMILVNLRKDAKSGEVKTENHLLPTGGFFNIISSPHMFFEIVMYLAILGLLPTSTTWILVVIWVFVNQLANALLTHKWYKENFKNYPKNRKALIPFIL